MFLDLAHYTSGHAWSAQLAVIGQCSPQALLELGQGLKTYSLL